MSAPLLPKKKVSRATPPEELSLQESALRTLLEEGGWSLSAVAERLKRSPSSVWRLMRLFPDLDKDRQKYRAGRVRSGRRPIVKNKTQLEAVLKEAGWDLEKAGEALSANPRTVREWVVKLGLDEAYRRAKKRAVA